MLQVEENQVGWVNSHPNLRQPHRTGRPKASCVTDLSPEWGRDRKRRKFKDHAGAVAFLHVSGWFTKCSERQFFNTLTCNELSPKSCALFVDKVRISRRETVETRTLLRRHRKPLYPRKQSPIMFSHVNSHTSEFLPCPTILNDEWLT